MNTLTRWCKFNLIGALGMAVQLGSLAFLNRVSRGHYLLASAIAVESAVLQNFAWHIRFTWRDRRTDSHWPSQILRFHLSNGLVSLLGNLLLMRLLVHGAHLRVVPANLIAIACCSILNFELSDRWAFSQRMTNNSAPQHCHLDRSRAAT